MTYAEFVAGRAMMNHMLTIVTILAVATVAAWRLLPRRWRWIVPTWSALVTVAAWMYFLLEGL